MECSMPGLPIHHQLPEFTQTHIHWAGDAIQPSHSLSSPSPPSFNLSHHQGLFKWVSSSNQVAKVLEFQIQHQSFQWIIRTDYYCGESGHPCFGLDLRGNAFSFSPLRIMFAVGLSYMAFLCWGSSFYAHFLKSFNYKCVLNFVKGFFCICWDYHRVFIFQFVNMVYHTDWFVYIEESLHPWNKCNLIMAYELLDVLLNSVC